MIGHAFLRKNEKSTSILSSFFHPPIYNSVANELKKCEEKTPQECWSYLLHAYEKLPKADAPLSMSILRVFELAFGFQFDPYNKSLLESHMKSVKEISPQFSEAIKDFYTEINSILPRTIKA